MSHFKIFHGRSGVGTHQISRRKLNCYCEMKSWYSVNFKRYFFVFQDITPLDPIKLNPLPFLIRLSRCPKSAIVTEFCIFVVLGGREIQIKTQFLRQRTNKESELSQHLNFPRSRNTNCRVADCYLFTQYIYLNI